MEPPNVVQRNIRVAIGARPRPMVTAEARFGHRRIADGMPATSDVCRTPATCRSFDRCVLRRAERMVRASNQSVSGASIPMYTNFASATLIVLGVVIAILGFLLAGNLQMVVIGLLSVLAGGLLGLADRRRVA
jgi:uncharacterized membrane protein